MPLASPSKPSPSPSTPRNPISLRLYKVLGANFDDEGTKQALSTLSELYAPSPNIIAENGKAATAQDSLSDSDSDEDDTGGFSSVPSYFSDSLLPNGSVPGETAARARKNLRRDVENKLTEASHQFLKAFGEVDQVCSFHTLCVVLWYLIKLVHSNWTPCKHTYPQCACIVMRLKVSWRKRIIHVNLYWNVLEACGRRGVVFRPVVNAEFSRLHRQEITTKQSIITLFLSRFTLNDEETEAMISRDVPIGQRFFDAMDKTERIRQDCQVLMAGEEGPTQAGSVKRQCSVL